MPRTEIPPRCQVPGCDHIWAAHRSADDPRGGGCWLCPCENFAIPGVHFAPVFHIGPNMGAIIRAGEPAAELLRDLIDELGECDHAVNICNCGAHLELEGLERVLRDARRRIGEGPTARDTELDKEDARAMDDDARQREKNESGS